MKQSLIKKLSDWIRTDLSSYKSGLLTIEGRAFETRFWLDALVRFIKGIAFDDLF